MANAIITGASKGLGRALALALADEGWTVVADARHADALEAVAAARPDSITALPGDVNDPDHRQALIDRASAQGGIELVVNNAGGLGPSPLPALASFPLDDLRELFEVNVVAPLALIQLALPHLVASRGAIINVTSDAAVEGYEGWGGYGSTKAALEQLSRVLGAEQHDVAVWLVDPGDMRTDMHQAAFLGEDISDRPEPEMSVPGIVRLIHDRPASGRYLARDVVPLPGGGAR
ncbi:MAG: SDR family oxidoreductase [Actinobacteria bacterium]|nr:SDR family oxidoreductase [Actinomycetota bacterium]